MHDDNYVDNSYISSIESVLLSDKYINELEHIKLNLEIELYMLEKFKMNFDFLSISSIAIALTSIIYTVETNRNDSFLKIIKDEDFLMDYVTLSNKHNSQTLLIMLSYTGTALILIYIFYLLNKKKYFETKTILECVKKLEDDNELDS